MLNSFNYVGKKKNDYFEGWYVKTIDSINDHAHVLILGVSTKAGDEHCFVQYFSEGNDSGKYYRYDINQFDFSSNYVSIGNCVLTPNYMSFKEDDIDIKLEFTNKLDIKRNLMQAGTMGYYKMIPMDSYHETVFLKAEVEGVVNGEHISGLSYVEKSYGDKFPGKYFWIQSNHFSKQNCSLLVSGAVVEALGKKKLGFFAIVNVNDYEFRFATYNSSYMHVLESNDSKLEIILFRGDYRCHINVAIKEGCKLKAPSKDGAMTDVIEESVDSQLTLSLFHNNDLIFSDKADYVGVENRFSIS